MRKRILFISLPERLAGQIEGFTLDPSIPLPVEVTDEDWDIARLEWPAIVSGILHVLRSDGDHEEADYYRRLIKTVRPDIVDTLLSVGELKTNQGDFSFAEEIFLSLAALEPDKGIHRSNLALFYRKREEAELRKDEFYGKALSLIRDDKPEEGLPLIDSFLENRPDSYNGWFLKGWALRLSERWEEALIAFERAGEIISPSPELLNEFAICERSMGDFEKASGHLRQGLEEERENTTLLSNLAMVYLDMNDLSRAEDVLALLYEIDPDDPLVQRFSRD
ncbi:MAG: tetratricopeptide repeat protein [Spirochaetales bacterium]|nr:tetratricopeptide repeat protein [Spirochaetales bacterium]